MGTYVVTGAASGIGAATAESLRAAGHRVIGVDLHDADVVADLSTAGGRRIAIGGILSAAEGRLDGAVLAAGLGPGKDRERMIGEVNVLGVTELLTALQPALAAANNAKVVVFGSNSTTATPFVPRGAIRRLRSGDVEGAARVLRRRGPLSGAVAYAASKIAVTHWCREQAVSPEWAGAGVRLNVIAPGPVMTPLLESQLAGSTASQVRSFPLPIREYGTAEQLSAWVMNMLSPAADFLVGSVIVVDGGTEALLRTRDWPRALPLVETPRMLWTMYRAPKRGQIASYGD